MTIQAGAFFKNFTFSEAIPMRVGSILCQMAAAHAMTFMPVLCQRRIQHFKSLDARVPSPFAEFREHELGIRLVVRRTDVVRLRRHLLQPCPLVGWIEKAVEFFLQPDLFQRVRAGESEQVRGSIARSGGERRGKNEGRAGDGTQNSDHGEWGGKRTSWDGARLRRRNFSGPARSRV